MPSAHRIRITALEVIADYTHTDKQTYVHICILARTHSNLLECQHSLLASELCCVALDDAGLRRFFLENPHRQRAKCRSRLLQTSHHATEHVIYNVCFKSNHAV